MTSKSKKKRERQGNRARRHHGGRTEDRRAEAVTVAWMISTVATAVGIAVSAVVLWTAQPPEDSQSPGLLASLAPLMLFSATITGLVALCLTPLVYFFRRHPPPLLITVCAVGIAIAPWATLLVMASR